MPELSTLGHVIKQAYEGQPDTNAFTNAEKNKLANLSDIATSGSYDDLKGVPPVVAAGQSTAEARQVIGAIPLSEKAVPGGVAPLDGSGVVPMEHLNVSGLSYLGAWDAATNTPELVNGAGSVGDFFKCSSSGTQDFGSGSHSFNEGDWVIYAGGVWQRIGVHEAVASVNGKTGSVQLTAEDVGALPDDYTPPATHWDDIPGKPVLSTVRGNISPAIPAAFVRLSGNTTVHSPVQFDLVVYDQFGAYSPGSGMFTVPEWATYARLTASVAILNLAEGRHAYAQLLHNGDHVLGMHRIVGDNQNNNIQPSHFVTPIMPVSGGDTIGVRLFGGSGLTMGSGHTYAQLELYTTN